MNKFSLSLPALLPLLGLVFSLSACADREKQKYVADCKANALGNGEQCACLYDLGKSSLSKEQLALFLAVTLNDQQEVSRLQARLGVFSGAQALARIGWVAANADSACQIKIGK
jgi:hypothetical protein